MSLKKQRKTTKEVDRQCKRRLNGTRNEHERSGGQQQEQKEKSCWGLIVGERLTEEKLERIL